ncbi:MAG TPA: GNVR domain-containing protein [Thermodesulfobacteriota bacterium]|nr:GNVR domain-containing protein [Thermodesulfobacteriota bacterium]
MNEEQEIHLLDYWEVIKRRKWIIIATVICFLATVGLGTFLVQPIYQAGARIKVGKEQKLAPPTFNPGGGYWESDYSESLAFKTHSIMIKSLPVLARSAKALRLNEPRKEEKKPTLKEEVRENLGKIKTWFLFPFSLFSFSPETPEIKTSPVKDDPYVTWAGFLQGEIEVVPIRDTRLIEVSVVDSDPVFCRDAANAICKSYLQYLSESRLDSFRNYLSFFSDEIFKMKEKLQESEQKFYEFKQKEGIFSLEGEKDISARDIGSLSGDLLTAKVETSGLEEKVRDLERMLKGGNTEDFSPAILDNKLLFDLRADLIKATIEQEELKKTYKERHPAMVENNAKIRELQESFRREIAKTIAALKQQTSMLRGKEARLSSQMKDKENENLSLSGKELRYAMLEREVTTNKELYQSLLTNFKEMEVLKGIGQEDVRLVEEAQTPLFPIKPRPARNMFLALIVGLSVGVGLSFFLEYMDRSIKEEKDVDKYLKLPTLSLVPKDEPLARGELSGDLSESLRTLATNLRFQSLGKPLKTLFITGPGGGVGKTTLVKGLGSTLAQSGFRVAIVDADFKKPSLSHAFAQKNQGVTEFLRDFPCLENKGVLNDTFSFGDIQRIIFTRGKSGRVKIVKGDKNFLALFDRGAMIDLCWGNRPIEKRLGQILLRTKAIEKESLDDALDLAKSANQRIGSVLLSMGSVAPERMENLLNLHLSETLNLLFSSEEGFYEFTEGEIKKDGLVVESFMDKFQLQGNSPWLEKNIRSLLVNTETENLFLLPSGPPLHNPLPLISSRGFEVVLSMCRDLFDYILLDGPPLFMADAPVLSQYSDGSILVVKAGVTRPEEAKKATETLKAAGAPIIGVVLNGIDRKKSKYYYYYFGKNYGMDEKCDRPRS